MRRWRLSPAALNDLVSVADYIELQGASQAAADGLLEDFYAAFDALAASPRMGHLKPQLTGTRLRWWPVRGYLIVYAPDTKPLKIGRVIHGARDLSGLHGLHAK